MRFLTDMGISIRTTAWLNDAGHDAVHLVDEGLCRLTDAAVLSKVQSKERILLTMDLDFGRLLADSAAALPSVIIFRLKNERSECVNARITEVIKTHENSLLSGALILVREQSMRIRRLPFPRTQA